MRRFFRVRVNTAGEDRENKERRVPDNAPRIVSEPLVELIDDTTVDPISYIIKSPSNSFIMSPVNETSVSLLFSQPSPKQRVSNSSL